MGKRNPKISLRKTEKMWRRKWSKQARLRNPNVTAVKPNTNNFVGHVNYRLKTKAYYKSKQQQQSNYLRHTHSQTRMFIYSAVRHLWCGKRKWKVIYGARKDLLIYLLIIFYRKTLLLFHFRFNTILFFAVFFFCSLACSAHNLFHVFSPYADEHFLYTTFAAIYL